ncbi:hypothetical protein [Diaphorobacter caeni]|uniref:hypothetical protein n=1 Tax=Diaphorobacter caeni TaxID=2784387 RepID=UPI00188FE939|nr:hypothetical protein [Diaphorobacter caeni]
MAFSFGEARMKKGHAETVRVKRSGVDRLRSASMIRKVGAGEADTHVEPEASAQSRRNALNGSGAGDRLPFKRGVQSVGQQRCHCGAR